MTQFRVLLPMLAFVATMTMAMVGARAQDAGYAKGDMAVGADDAPVTVIEYASMTCPHCANFHMGTYKELKAKYIDTGKMRLIFREFPFDPLALQASMLARCAGAKGGKSFFGMLNVLFKGQAKWAKASNPQQALAKIARLAGFTDARFQACMTNRELADMIIQSRLDGNQKYAVDSTPSFIVNGEKTSGHMTLDRWDALLAKHLN